MQQSSSDKSFVYYDIKIVSYFHATKRNSTLFQRSGEPYRETLRKLLNAIIESEGNCISR